MDTIMAGQKTDERDRLLGSRLVEYRKRAKLTQRKVADSFNMSAAQLQKYEKGTNRISAIHLAILSRSTGVPIAAFLDGIPVVDTAEPPGLAESPQAPILPESPLAGLALAVTQHVRQNFNERDRREIAGFADILGRGLSD